MPKKMMSTSPGTKPTTASDDGRESMPLLTISAIINTATSGQERVLYWIYITHAHVASDETSGLPLVRGTYLMILFPPEDIRIVVSDRSCIRIIRLERRRGYVVEVLFRHRLHRDWVCAPGS